jgi:hypothetical protein
MSVVAETSDNSLAIGIIGGLLCFGYFGVWRWLPNYRDLWRKREEKRATVTGRGSLQAGTRYESTKAEWPNLTFAVKAYLGVGAGAIALTILLLIFAPHSNWVGWVGLIDLVILVASFVARRSRDNALK